MSLPEHADHTGTVAAFDFDGTLIRGDSFLPFLRMACGTGATGWALAMQGRPVVGRMPRDDIKAAVLSRLLAGQDQTRLSALGQSYGHHLVARRLRPALLERLRDHQGAGHRVVIVSASPELYLATVGRLLGVEAVLATRLVVGPDGRLTGAIDGFNCRGPEKCARLLAWLGQSPAMLHAYGDSAGDAELLAMADVRTWVRSDGRLSSSARRAPGLWPRPQSRPKPQSSPNLQSRG